MQITPEYLRELIKDAETQRANYLAMYNKADGAIQALEQLLISQAPEPDAISMDRVAELVGGNGAIVEGIDNAS